MLESSSSAIGCNAVCCVVLRGARTCLCSAGSEAWVGERGAGALLAGLQALFALLWLLPVYCISFALSCVWCACNPCTPLLPLPDMPGAYVQ